MSEPYFGGDPDYPLKHMALRSTRDTPLRVGAKESDEKGLSWEYDGDWLPSDADARLLLLSD